MLACKAAVPVTDGGLKMNRLPIANPVIIHPSEHSMNRK
jgi:hypothetical protein